jgi:GNAT superfamily N-acetyltransferase
VDIRKDVLDWLLETGFQAAVDDLSITYSFAHPLNHQREVVRQSLSLPPRDPSALWGIQFFAEDGQQLLDRGDLCRKVFSSLVLAAGGGRGRVAYHATFYLKPQFQNRGFGGAVHQSELALYRKWGIREIQLTAFDEGRVVWPRKFGFRPIPILESILHAEYPAWAARNRKDPSRRDNILEYPDEFFLSRQQLDMYKVVA